MILVTGGAGFIGAHLVERLIAAGEPVRVLDRRPARTSTAESIVGDIRDSACVRDAVRGCRQVYHLAANPQLWARRRSDFHRVNYLGTVNVLDEAVAAGAERIVHVSTESILTRAQQTSPIAEDQVVYASDVIGPYCLSKFRAERHAFRLARNGAPIVVVNPTLPVGPGDVGLSPPTRMILDCCLGKRTAYLDAELNLIDVRDVAHGIERAMAVGEPGRRYLLGAENWSIRQLFEAAATRAGVPGPRTCVPYAVALMAAYVSEFIADVVTHRMPAASITGVKLTRRRMHFDAGRSLAELGVAPRPIERTLDELVAWFRASKMI